MSSMSTSHFMFLSNSSLVNVSKNSRKQACYQIEDHAVLLLSLRLCRCCLPLEGTPIPATLAWSVSGCSAARSAFSPSILTVASVCAARHVQLTVCASVCVQHREDPCEREGSDQCRSYLRHRISAAWTPLRYRPLSACWDTAGPSTLQRGQHLGNQFVNSYADCEMMCIFLAVFILHVFLEPVCQPNVAYETIKSEAI